MVCGVVGRERAKRLRERQQQVDTDHEKPHLRRERRELREEGHACTQRLVLLYRTPEFAPVCLSRDGHLHEECDEKLRRKEHVRHASPKEQRQRFATHTLMLAVLMDNSRTSADGDDSTNKERSLGEEDRAIIAPGSERRPRWHRRRDRRRLRRHRRHRKEGEALVHGPKFERCMRRRRDCRARLQFFRALVGKSPCLCANGMCSVGSYFRNPDHSSTAPPKCRAKLSGCVRLGLAAAPAPSASVAVASPTSG